MASSLKTGKGRHHSSRIPACRATKCRIPARARCVHTAGQLIPTSIAWWRQNIDLQKNIIYPEPCHALSLLARAPADPGGVRRARGAFCCFRIRRRSPAGRSAGQQRPRQRRAGQLARVAGWHERRAACRRRERDQHRGRGEIPAQRAGAQTLYRRPQQHHRHPHLWPDQQRALAGVCRRRVAVQFAGQPL